MGLNTVTVLFGRINNNFTTEECDLLEVNSIENNCVMEDPWLYLKTQFVYFEKTRGF